MNNQSFSLLPFASSPLIQDIKITGTLGRQNNTLTIHYTLFAPHSAVDLPVSSGSPLRKHELWEATCFEFFLACQNQEPYWEFNLSPTGDWNIYRFETYRQGMQEELAFTSLPIATRPTSDGHTLELSLNLDEIIPTTANIEVAISAVIKPRLEEATYWALIHPGVEADFHRRDSFILQI